MNILDEYIDIIDIPDIENNFNEKYFIFGKAPLCLYSKKTPLLIFLMISLFIILKFISSQGILMWTILLLMLFVSMYYYYENRYIKYYKKASKYSNFSMYDKMMAQIYKLIKSNRVYLIGMPYAYSILKSKQLISSNVIGAECIADQVIDTFPSCIEALYIRALCLCSRNNYTEAKEILKRVIAIKSNQKIVNAAADILKNLESI